MEMMKAITLLIELQPEKIPNWMVICMGIGTVFVGLICIIILCNIVGSFFAKSKKPSDSAPAKITAATQNNTIENRQEIIAAVTAACAEDMGKDVSALRVISFKKL